MGNRESGIVKSQPITHNQFSIHPIYLGLTQLNKSSPPSPPTLGEPEFKVPQNWGASAVLGSPQVEHLAWIKGASA